MKNEPIAIIRAVVVLLTLLAGFLGVQITEDEQGMITENALAIFGSGWALFEVVAAIYARSKVSPVATTKASRVTPVSIVLLASLWIGGCTGGGFLQQLANGGLSGIVQQYGPGVVGAAQAICAQEERDARRISLDDAKDKFCNTVEALEPFLPLVLDAQRDARVIVRARSSK